MKVGSAFKKLLGGKGKPKKSKKKEGEGEGEDVGLGGKDLNDLLSEIDDIDEDMGEEEESDDDIGFDDDEEEEAGGGMGGVGGTDVFAIDNERLEMKMKETDDKVQKVEQGLTAIQSDNDNLRGEVSEVRDDIRKLLSIYEIVYKDINPFIEDDSEETMQLPSPFDEDEMMHPPSLPLDEEDVADIDIEIPDAIGIAMATPVIDVETSATDGEESDIARSIGKLLEEKKYEEAFEALKDGIENLEESSSEEDEELIRSRLTFDLLGGSRKGPILTKIPTDYLSNVTLLRWLEFLLEKLPRRRILLLLEYYVNIRWISSNVKYRVVSFLRGEMGGISPPPPPPYPDRYRRDEPSTERSTPRPPANFDMPELKPITGESLQPWNIQPPPPYGDNGVKGYRPHLQSHHGGNPRTNGQWRLTAEDHLKSLLFINMIAGNRIDKDQLSCLEYDIEIIKHALEGFHGI